LEPQTRRALIARLHQLPKREKEKLFARAEILRTQRASQTKAPRLKNRDLDEVAVAPRPPRAPAVEEVALELLAQDIAFETGENMATVLSVRKARAVVSQAGVTRVLPLSPDLTSRQQTEVAVGDEVFIAQDRIDAVRPRRTELSRSDPGSEIKRVIVANVDLVVHVVSVVSPPLHPRIIDRVRLAASVGGCAYAIAVNKTELPGAEVELARLDPYRNLGIPICEVSARTGDGIDALTELMKGQLSAFVGHSGVGKSSLLNAITGREIAATGSVSEGNRRGAHTTRVGTLWDLSESIGPGTRIIDTPGVRSFGIVSTAEEVIEDAFPEFQDFTCRFRDCSHTVEPGCGVLAALADGTLSPYRYDTYIKMRG